jgi:hypothetical protein
MDGMLRRHAAGVIAVMLAFAQTAHADAPSSDTEPLSSAAATSLSLGVTAAGGALIGSAWATDNHDLRGLAVIAGGAVLIVGPSVGHWYAGTFRPTTGAVVRYAGLGVAAVGLAVAVENCHGEIAYDDFIHSCSPRDSTFGMAAIGVGLAGVLAGAIYDVWTVPADVRRENARRASTGMAWTVSPLYTPAARGLSLAARF